MDNAIISSKIKELRTSLNLTQADFASSLGTTQAALSGYERGDRLPSLELLFSLSEKYTVSLDWLCGLSEKKSPTPKIETYSDLIQIIMDIEDAPNISISHSLKNYTSNDIFTPSYETLVYEINDKNIVNFFKEWQDIRSTCEKTPSGEKLYSIWLKDIFERFNFKLEDASQHLDTNSFLF